MASWFIRCPREDLGFSGDSGAEVGGGPLSQAFSGSQRRGRALLWKLLDLLSDIIGIVSVFWWGLAFFLRLNINLIAVVLHSVNSSVTSIRYYYARKSYDFTEKKVSFWISTISALCSRSMWKRVCGGKKKNHFPIFRAYLLCTYLLQCKDLIMKDQSHVTCETLESWSVT